MRTIRWVFFLLVVVFAVSVSSLDGSPYLDFKYSSGSLHFHTLQLRAVSDTFLCADEVEEQTKA